MTKILKSAWQLAKELTQERNLDINSIKIEIIRAGQAGSISIYTYRKDEISVNLYEEEEVKAVFKLAEKLTPFSIEPTSKKMQEGYWYPELTVAENQGNSIHIMLWSWPQKRFPDKTEADNYARAAGIEKLRRMVS